jgi:type I restriction enzyme M protein
VGVAEQEIQEGDFVERLIELNEELQGLCDEARKIENTITENVVKVLKKV